jgi:short-subunit dehydrogenase
MKVSFESKVVIVTGASAGIGQATAHLFAKAGANVVLVARRLEALNAVKEELAAYNSSAITISADLSKEEDLQRIYRTVMQHHHRIDILVNNAGTAHGGALDDLDAHQTGQMIAINIYGPIRLTQLVLPSMRKQNSGHIVNVSSTAGPIAPPGEAVYAATRSAMLTFSHSLRRELAKSGVGVSVVLPGWTRTAMVGQMNEQALRAAGLLTPFMAFDDPAVPAKAIFDAVRHKRPQTMLGGPAFSFADLLGRISQNWLDLYYRWFMDTEKVCKAMRNLGA